MGEIAAKSPEDLMTEVVARLRAHLPVAGPIEQLQLHYASSPETLFCLGLQAWSEELAAPAHLHWTELNTAHPQHPLSAIAVLLLREVEQRLESQGGLEKCRAFEEALRKAANGTPQWRVAVEEAADSADPEQLLRLGRACFAGGTVGAAVSLSSRALAEHRDLLSTWAEVGFYLLVMGDWTESAEISRYLAQQEGGHLAALQLIAGLGNDGEVLLLYGECIRQELPFTPTQMATAHHLAAVSLARLGSWTEAVEKWTQALAVDPRLQVARENLENAALEENQRHSPWPFPFYHWIPTHQEAGQQRLLPLVLPILLDRGDPYGCEWALNSALREVEAYQVPLRKFATGTRGREEARALVVQALVPLHLLPARFPYFSQGQWSVRELEAPPATLFSSTTEGLLGSLSQEVPKKKRSPRSFR